VGTAGARAALDEPWRKSLALTPSMRAVLREKLAELTNYVREQRAGDTRRRT
jgi:hypothetical protein